MTATFAELNLLPSLVASLTAMDRHTPTEIQAAAIPELLSGRSVVGIAETGSGKTLAYGLPTLQICKTLETEGAPVEAEGQPRAVILVPTRELGEQVTRVLKALSHETRVRVRSALGGTTAEIARRNVAGAFEILVATPGRLLKQLDARLIRLSDVRLLVLDEVDQMLDMGFLPDVQRVVAGCPSRRQLALFSATVASRVEGLIKALFGPSPKIIRTRGSHREVATLKTVNRTVLNGDRLTPLLAALAEESVGGTLLFVNTREQCDQVAGLLMDAGHRVSVYRGEMDKIERRANLEAFRKGETALLITTDLGSRGLDLPLVGRVINVHLCTERKNYLHRVGRTARAGRAGVVINLVTERDRALMERLAGGGAKDTPDLKPGKPGKPKPLGKPRVKPGQAAGEKARKGDRRGEQKTAPKAKDPRRW